MNVLEQLSEKTIRCLLNFFKVKVYKTRGRNGDYSFLEFLWVTTEDGKPVYRGGSGFYYHIISTFFRKNPVTKTVGGSLSPNEYWMYEEYRYHPLTTYGRGSKSRKITLDEITDVNTLRQLLFDVLESVACLRFKDDYKVGFGGGCRRWPEVLKNALKESKCTTQ